MSTGRSFSGSGASSGLTQSQVDARVTALATGLSQAQTDARIALLAPSDWKGVVADQAARLAMAGLVVGDEVWQSDTKQAFLLVALPATTPSNWAAISAPDALMGATAVLPGLAGYPSAPLAGAQDMALFGDATWRQIAPDWVASHAYSAGAVVVAENSLFRRVAAGTSGAGWDAAERMAWTRIGSAQLGSIVEVTPTPTPQTLAELELFMPAADMPPGTQWLSRVFSSAAGACNQLAMVVGGQWTWVGMTPLMLVDKTPGLYPPDLVALAAQVNPATRPAWETWVATCEIDVGIYRTAKVLAGVWEWAEPAPDASSAAAIPVGVKVDVTPTPRPTSLANLTALVPPGNQEPGQVWTAILAPTPTTLRQAEIVDGIWQWASTPGGSSSAAATMSGATSTVVGTGGSVPAPLAGQQDWFVRGDGTWAQVAPDFVPNRPYSAGALVVFGGVLYRRIAAGTSLASFAADTANWLALGSTGGGTPMVGATNLADGTGGTVPAPLRNDMDVVLHGDGVWREIAPDWLANVAYSQGALVVAGGVLYRSNASRTSGATFNAAEALNWTAIGGATSAMTGATASVAGTAGTVPAPAIGTQGLPFHGDGTFKGVLTAWQPLTPYSAGQLIFTNAGIWKRKIAGTSGGGTFNVTEQLDWDLVADLINAPLSFRGGFDPTAGVLPGAGLAQPGYFYIATVAGTVGGRTFAVGDQLYALVANAPTGVYAGNWLHVPVGGVEPYMDTFNLVDWVLSAGDRILTYPIATHNQGTTPFVWVESLNGVNFDQVETQITLDPAGNVTLTIPDGNEFDGRVSISSGLGGASGASATLGTGANAAGSLAGTSGSFIAPAAGDNRAVLRGDNSWGVNIPPFEAATFYRLGHCIVQGGQIYMRSVAGLSGANFAADVGNWTVIGGASQYTTPFAIASWAGVGPVTLAITAATHGMGLNPRVQVSEATGAGAFRLVSIQTDIAANGDVTFTAGAGFDGRLTIF